MPPVALVTAGSAGLGAETALLLARRGYNVVINYHSDDVRAAALVRKLDAESSLPNSDRRFKAIKADLASRDECTRMVDESVGYLHQENGDKSLDVLFSNGGWTTFTNIRDLDENMDEEVWDRCFAMNVKSHLWLMHAAKPYLERAEGCFVTTASLAGVKVSGSCLAYCVTKAAQIHLAKGLALAASPKVRVNTVSPGLLLTEWGQRFGEEAINDLTQRTPLKQVPRVEDVAEQVWCFIQSKTVTGANAVIDGGLSQV